MMISYIFSFSGIVIWELFTLGDEPYQEIEIVSDLISYLASGQRLPYPNYCNDEIYDIMKECWYLKRDERPKFANLKSSFEVILATLKSDIIN